MDTLNMNDFEYKELKMLYNNAKSNNNDSFIFQNKTLVTDYAKYLIEHLSNTFEKKINMNKIKLQRALYLDDLRTPTETIPNFEEWYVVRDYNQFVEWVEKNGLPDYISFDHDLKDEHMEDYWKYQFKGIPTIDYDTFTEKTGLDCAKWLVDYVEKNKTNLPRLLGVHSANPIGASNIQNFLNGYKKHIGQEENVFISKPKHTT
jgi:hypothetical protein